MYPDRPERYISLVVRLFLPAFNTRFRCCLLRTYKHTHTARSGRLSTDPYRSILFIDCRFIILFFPLVASFVFFLLPRLFLFLLILRAEIRTYIRTRVAW